MRQAIIILPLCLLAAACEAPRVYTYSTGPGFIEIGADDRVQDQALANRAQLHCEQQGRNAVPVRRDTRVTMPSLLDGRIILYHCR
jgi:putative hemolysin